MARHSPLSLILVVVSAACGGGDQPISVQLHTHGSLSEGAGSMAAHTSEADRVGVDVIWWTDHDWRISLYRHVSNFGFEITTGPSDDRVFLEPLSQDEPWTPTIGFEQGIGATKHWVRTQAAGLTSFEARTDTDAFEGSASMQLSATADDAAFTPLRYGFDSRRSRHKRPIAADVEIHLAIKPVSLGPDARAFVDITLSNQPATVDADAQQYRIRYLIDDSGLGAWTDGGIRYEPRAYTADTWTHYEFHLTDDVIAAFPLTDALDNSVYDISVGVEARNGATATALFDDFEIIHQHAGAPLLEAQLQILARLAADVDSVVHHQGIEVSYFNPHLNEYSLTPTLFDYDVMLAQSGLADEDGQINKAAAEAYLTPLFVDAVHARGGLVSWAHPFGVSGQGGTPPENIRDNLLSTRAYGADMLEVGYPLRSAPLEDYLWVWDQLAINGLIMIGVGVSDTHLGHPGDWTERTNNYVSWVHAHDTGRDSLIEGMRRGRVFFGDINDFDGSLEIETDRGFRMGRIIVTDRPDLSLTMHVDGAQSGDVVHIISNGMTVETVVLAGPEIEFARPYALGGASITAIRMDLHRDGDPIAHSNPVFFVELLAGFGR